MNGYEVAAIAAFGLVIGIGLGHTGCASTSPVCTPACEFVGNPAGPEPYRVIEACCNPDQFRTNGLLLGACYSLVDGGC